MNVSLTVIQVAKVPKTFSIFGTSCEKRHKKVGLSFIKEVVPVQKQVKWQ